MNRQILRLWRRFRFRYVDRFVFVHINKNAGTSIERALNLELNHNSVRGLIWSLGQKEWDRRFTFAVVRNPWDRVLSQYFFRRRSNRTFVDGTELKFNEWVRLVYGYPLVFRMYDSPNMFLPQVDWLINMEGKIGVDYVCRFENLEADMKEVCRRMGRNITLPHVNSTDHEPYWTYYESDTRELVREWFKKDIEMWGYSFGDE